jgi:hypothetical protein
MTETKICPPRIIVMAADLNFRSPEIILNLNLRFRNKLLHKWGRPFFFQVKDELRCPATRLLM